MEEWKAFVALAEANPTTDHYKGYVEMRSGFEGDSDTDLGFTVDASADGAIDAMVDAEARVNTGRSKQRSHDVSLICRVEITSDSSS
jgi:hypothetical protein